MPGLSNLTSNSGLDPLSSLSSTTFPLTNGAAYGLSSAPDTGSSSFAAYSSSLPFAVRAEGTFTLNNGGDFDGIPLDPSDDALIYAGRGFTLNNSATLPVQRDSFGNPLRDSANRMLLVDRAVTVASGYTTLNVSSSLTNQYATLNPPQVVPTETIIVPTYATLKQQDLDRRIPVGTPTVTFNIGSNPINSAADWYNKFPPPGTTTQPKVVRVIGGGLNIPGNVTLSNTVITVENGDINFNGSGHTFNNVALITNNGNINLSNVAASDLSVFAANSINMNSGARFGGFSLLATGASGSSINFNGASTTTTSSSNLRVVSQGDITFNAATATRGDFLSVRNFTFNNTSTLYGSIGAKNNILFNGNGTVIYNTISQPSTNQAPTDITLSSNTVAENSSTSTQIATLTTTDPDANDTHTYTLLDNAEGRFQLTGNQLQVANGTLLDFETTNSHTISIRSTDAGGLSITRSFTITVTNVNEAPLALTLSGNTVVEQSTNKTVIGTLTTTDPDIGGSHTYTLLNNANGRFAILNGNQLVIADGTLLDFEAQTSHSIRIRTTDQGGLSIEQDLLITITNINEAPTALILSSTNTPEAIPAGSVVAVLSTTDPDAGNTHTYSLVAGPWDTDNAAFSVVGNELRVNASPDFETQSSYTIRLRTTDQGGLSFDSVITLTVININEAPTALSLSNTTLPENVPPGTTIGLFTTTDQDVNNTHTYSLVTGAGDPDLGIFTIVGNELRLNPSPDFETRTTYPVRVKTTDQGGSSYTQDFTITITNVNETPSFTSNGVISINERETYNYSITTTDPDSGDTRLISAPTLPTWLTFVDNGNGTATLSGTPTSAEIGTHPIELQVTDTGGLSAGQTFTLTVLNINDAPTDFTLTPASIAENVSTGSLVGFLNTTDPDTSDNHSYSLVPGAGDSDNAAFIIAGNELRITTSPDFETKDSYTIRIRTTDQAGLFLDKQFTIQVANVNEAPSFSSSATTTTTAGENYSYSVTTVDPDIGDVRTISAPALPPWLTLTNTSIGTATLSANPTNAQVGTYDITLIVTDADGLTATQQFILTVNASNTAPTGLTLTPTATPENVAANSVMGLFTTTDPDAGDSYSYSLVPGSGDTDNAEFTIVGNQLKINTSPDFETKASYSIRVRTTDGAGAFYDRAITITITDVNEAPIALALSNATIPENAPTNTLVGTISTTDPDVNNTHTYTLVNDADGRFTIANGNRLVVAANSLLDFETTSTHLIRLRTTDQGGLSYEQDVEISLSNVNEAPRFTSIPIGNASSDTPYQYNITVTDPDAGDTITLSASSLPSWLTFTPTGNGTGIISGTPNLAQSGLYSILLTATDTSGLSTAQPLLLSVDTLLQEGSNFTVSRSTSFTIPNSPSILQFTVDPLIFDQSDLDHINDAFEVALIDAQGNALTHTISLGRNSFFNWTEGEETAQATGVTYNATTKTVSLNLTGITPGTLATLVFRLVNNDLDTTTSVRLQNLAILNAPSGTQPAIQSPTSIIQSSVFSGLFSLLTDVTPSIQAEYRRTSFNADSDLLYADLGLRNIGSYGLNRTLLATVDHISDPSVLVRNPDGFTPDGTAYYNFSHLLTDGNLDPNEISNRRSLIFYNPNQVQFSYDLTILAELNQAPVIQSNPTTEVISGQLYRYDVDATDANQDSLTYRLLSAPVGMTINANTGLIEWATSLANIGNHSLIVEASDERGGFTRQPYTLSVIDTPPNRPPIFTSSPVVDAYINQLYQYDADAIDPDQDLLNYRLIIGPDGMTVNSSTGLVEWTPPPTLLLGDTVLGRIGIPGESDEFTISGIAGQTLYFDPLQYSGNASDWSIKFLTPSGRQVASSDFRWHENRLITLDETGNYKIVVDAQSDRTGTYGFSIIDPSLIPITPLDTLIEGSLRPGTEDDLYRLSGAKGQKLYIDLLSRTGDADWVLYDARKQVVSSSWLMSDMEVELPVDGDYLLAIRGASAFTSTVNYSFEIITPDTITRSLPFNTIISDRITEKGEQDVYTFSGIAGQRLIYDVLSSDYLNLRLYDPAGREFFNGDARNDIYRDQANRELTLSATGTYRLVLDGYGEGIGNYQFRLLETSTAPVVSLDTPITGTLEPQGIQTYQVQLNDRTYLYIDGQRGVFGNDWNIYGADGQYITGNHVWADQERWFDPGIYTLMLRNYVDVSDRTYDVWLITPDVTTPQPLSLNSIIEGSIGEKGEQDTYTFTGTAGQQLFYDSLNNTTPFTVTVYDPTGRVISSFDSRSDRAPHEGLTLSVNGTYRVVIDGSGETRGDYKFRLLDRAAATTVNVDTDISGTLVNGIISAESYGFTLNDRTYLYIDGQLGSYDQWLLYNPAGQFVTNNYFFADRELWLDPGQYWLIMQGTGYASPSYQIKLITADVTTTQPILFGETITSAISEKGEQDRYTFTGIAGQQLFFDALDGNANLYYSLFTPQGSTQINSADIRYDRGFFDGLVLPTSGTYSLLIDGAGETTGNYKFRLLDRAATTTTPLDSTIQGTFSENLTSTELYNFTLTDRQYLYFDAQGSSSSPQSTGWILYSPNGQQIQSDRLWQDRERWLDPGNYTLAMQGYGAGYSDTYQFRIVTPDVQTQTPLILGTAVTSTLAEKGEQDVYTFTGTAGQRLYLDILDRGGVYTDRLSLKDPTGFEILGRWTWDDDPDPVTLAMNGVYTLTVDNTVEGTPAYSFNLLDLSSAIDITSNIGEIVDSTTGHAYRLASSATWTDAQTQAQAQGGYLVTINNAAENQFLVDNFSGSEHLWIGFNDIAQEGTWTWANGEPVTYTNWAGGEPNNAGGIEDHAFMNWAFSGGWADIFPTANYRGIVELNDSTGFTPATDNTGILASGRSTQLYQFSGQTGQVLRFIPLVAPATSNWTLYNSSNQIVMNSGASASPTITLATTDTYTLAIRGYHSAPTDYTFKVNELVAGTATAPTGTTINFNQIVEGAITTAGSNHSYTFTATAGQRLFYDGLGGSPLLKYLYDPSGRQVLPGGTLDSRSDVGPDSGFTLTMSGIYTLTVGGGSTGNYKFQLLDLNNAPIANLDQDITGILNQGAIGSQAFRFTVPDRQYFYIDGLVGDAIWTIFAANGQYVTSARLYQDQALWLNSGDYSLVIQGQNSAANYGIRLITPDLPTTDITTAIANGTDISGTIVNKGDVHSFTFTGTAGQQFFYDALSNDYFYLDLYDPTGRQIFDNVDSRYDRGPDGGFTLLMDGTYTLKMGGNDPYLGNYKFQLLDLTNAPVASLDSPLAGTFDHGAQGSVAYRFSLTNRQYIYFDAQQGDGYWYVYRPDASGVTYGRLWEDRQLWLDPGNYSIVFSGVASNANYRLNLVTPQLLSNPITLGTNTNPNAINGAILEKGEQDTYTFNGTAGQRLLLDVLNRGSYYSTSFNVYSPTGANIYGRWLFDDDHPEIVTLNETGPYRVVLDGSGEATDNYNFSLMDVAQADVIALDTTITGTLNPGRELQTYQFSGSSGQRLYLDAAPGTAGVTWTLYNAANQNLGSNGFSDFEVTLPQDGNYTLVLRGYSDTPQPYSFNLITPDTIVRPAQVGTNATPNVIADVTGEKGEVHVYTLDLTAGQRLFLDVLDWAGSDRSVYLDSPSGARYLSYDIRYNEGFLNPIPIRLRETGTYRLTVRATGADPGLYSFSLMDMNQAPPINLGETVTGTINPGQEAQFYRFNATAGQRLYLDSSPGTSGVYWRGNYSGLNL